MKAKRHFQAVVPPRPNPARPKFDRLSKVPVLTQRSESLTRMATLARDCIKINGAFARHLESEGIAYLTVLVDDAAKELVLVVFTEAQEAQLSNTYRRENNLIKLRPGGRVSKSGGRSVSIREIVTSRPWLQAHMADQSETQRRRFPRYQEFDGPQGIIKAYVLQARPVLKAYVL